MHSLLVIPTIFGHMYLGLVMAMLLGIAGPRGWALASAIYNLVINLVAMGVGPYTSCLPIRPCERFWRRQI
jgi:hypothetical protein